jgi:SSS family solute:Na+ symporter
MAPYLYSLYWRRTTRAGVWAGMLTGLATMVGLFLWKGAAEAPLWASIAMLVPFAVVPAVSLLSKPPAPEIVERSFARPHAG